MHNLFKITFFHILAYPGYAIFTTQMTGDNEYYIYEDNDPHISNPRSLGYMIWTKIPDSSLVVNFRTDGQIRSTGFSLEWKCANNIPDRCENSHFNAKVVRAIQSAFENDKDKYTRSNGNGVVQGSGYCSS